MDFIENIFVCLAAPLIITIICLKGKGRRLTIFLVCGMTVCLLASYISTFLAAAYGADLFAASLEISPMVEEIMKFLPVLFYILVFEPDKRDLYDAVIVVSVGFATFENACVLTQSGASDVRYLLIRGFGTGAMHVVCGMIVAFGIVYLWEKVWIRRAGTIGLISGAMVYHGIYNILVSQEGIPAYIGYLIPLITIILFLIFQRNREEITT